MPANRVDWAATGAGAALDEAVLPPTEPDAVEGFGEELPGDELPQAVIVTVATHSRISLCFIVPLFLAGQ